MLGYPVISITEVSMYILMNIIQTENTLLMGSPNDLYIYFYTGNIICTLHLDETSPLFKRLNILNFKKFVIQRIALLMFKYAKGVC